MPDEIIDEIFMFCYIMNGMSFVKKQELTEHRITRHGRSVAEKPRQMSC